MYTWLKKPFNQIYPEPGREDSFAAEVLGPQEPGITRASLKPLSAHGEQR